MKALAYRQIKVPFRQYNDFVPFFYGDEPKDWKTNVIIEFESFISNIIADDITEWCINNCDGRFIIPKVWWIEFELETDFQNFKQHFDLRFTTPSPFKDIEEHDDKIHIIKVDGSTNKNISSYEADFFWSNLNDWCNNNCSGEWFVSLYSNDPKYMNIQWYVVFYCFKNENDAINFKLTWL
jgi:hypothetical protein